MAVTAGYDVGGAHLKIALAENGRTIAVRQIPCALWRGLDHLDDAFANAADLIGRSATHAVTMTGELCELFANRHSGVDAILERLESLLGPDISVWMGMRGLGSLDAARADPMSVASTNFLASAALIAKRLPNALLVDMGSTTTDIVPVREGKIAARGLTDGDRLRSGELVYTGLTRADVSSVSHRGVLNGYEQRLAAGGFANMADVRRILRTLPDDVDQHATLDGRGTSVEESVERFARCFGRDAADAPLVEWQAAARDIADRQMREISAAVEEVAHAAGLPRNAPVVVAGIGAQEIAYLAERLDRSHHAFADVAKTTEDSREWATRCAPAVALAVLSSAD